MFRTGFISTMLAVAGLAVLTACATSKPAPDWVLLPKAENGFAATGCVGDSGNLGLDRQFAIAKARADIARQIETRVRSVDKTYAQIRQEQGQTVSSESFESVSEQIAEQALANAQAVRIERVTIDDADKLCAQVNLVQEQSQQLFRNIVTASGVSLDSATNETLYREFVGLP